MDAPERIRASGLNFRVNPNNGTQRLCSIDLTNGSATNLGAVGASLSGLAVGQTAVL